MTKFILLIKSFMIVFLLSGCGIFNGNGLETPNTEEIYIHKNNKNMSVKQARAECGFYQDIDKGLSDFEKTNLAYERSFCMQDKGFILEYGVSNPRGACQAYTRKTGEKLPICVARGAYK